MWRAKQIWLKLNEKITQTHKFSLQTHQFPQFQNAAYFLLPRNESDSIINSDGGPTEMKALPIQSLYLL